VAGEGQGDFVGGRAGLEEGKEVREVSVGDNVRRIREQRQIPQKRLAEIVGVSPPMISQIERGTKNPSLQIGKAIADALGCTMEELLGAEESG